MALAGTAFINFEGQFDGIEKDARRVGDKAGGDFSSGFGKKAKGGILGSFKSIAGGAAAIFAGAKVVDLFGDFISEARESAKVGRLTNNVIKQTKGAANISADAVGRLSEAISNKTGIDDEAIQSGANLLLTFKNIRNEAGKGNNIFDRTTQAAADLSIQFGGIDGASKQLGKALNDPLKGIAALGRAGVTFSATQKAQIKNFVQTGDLLSAQKIVLGEVESQVGGAAAAAADPMQKLRVIVDNLKERIGTALLPILEKAGTWLGEFLPKALDLSSKAFGWLADKIAPVVAVAKQAFDILFKGDFKGGPLAEDSPFVDGLFRVRDFITGRVMPALSQLGNFLKDNLGTVLTVVGGLMFGLAGALVVAYVKFKPFRDVVNGIAEVLREKLGQALEWVTETLIPAATGAFGDLIAGFKGDRLNGIFGTIGTAVSGLVDGLSALADAAVPVFGAIIGFVKRNPAPVFSALAAAAAVLGGAVLVSLVPAFIGWAASAGMAAISTFLLFAPIIAIVAGIALLVGGLVYAYKNFEGFRNVVDTVFAALKTAAGVVIGFVVDLFRNYLVPAAMAVGDFFTQTLWPAIQTAFAGIQAAVSFAWNSIIKPVFAALSAFVTTVLIPVFNTISAVGQFVFSLLWAVVQDAWGIIQPIFGAIVGFVRDSLIPKVQEIAAVAGTVFSAVSGAVSAAWDLVKPVFKAIFSFVTDKLAPVWEVLASAVSSAFDKIPGAISGALRLAGNIVAGFMRGVAGIAGAIGLEKIAGALSSGAAKADGWGEGGGGGGKTQKNVAPNRVQRMASGGFISGGIPGRDSVPAMLMPGEVVIRKSMVDRYGLGNLLALNAGQAPGFKAGGEVPAWADKLTSKIKGKRTITSTANDVAGLGGDLLGKLRAVAAGAVEKAWPKMDEPGNILGLAAGGSNYMRQGVIDLIKGEAKKREAAELAKEQSPSTGGSGLAASATGINPDFLARFRAWNAATGNRYGIGSGFRSYASQVRLYAKYLNGTGNLAARPGTSNHERGLAIDTSPRVSAADQALARAFRLHFPVRGEPWHIEPYAKGGFVHAKSFDSGGTLAQGWNMVRNDTGAPEPLVRPGQGGPLIGEAHFHDGVEVDLVLQKLSRKVMAGAL